MKIVVMLVYVPRSPHTDRGLVHLEKDTPWGCNRFIKGEEMEVCAAIVSIHSGEHVIRVNTVGKAMLRTLATLKAIGVLMF